MAVAIAEAVGGKSLAAEAVAEAERRRFEEGLRSVQVFGVQIKISFATK